MTKKDFLILVEGESDSWVLWYQDFPCLGFPGSSTAALLKPEYLRGIKTLFVWQEPDRGGKLFVDGISKRLYEIGFSGKAKIIDSSPCKDASDLWLKESKDFKKIVSYLMASAMPLPVYIPPVPKAIVRFQSAKGDLTNEQIERAREYPFCDLVGAEVGKKLICPNHEDSTPSLHIYKHNGFCFACGYQVDAIGWLRWHGLSFKQAVLDLQK